MGGPRRHGASDPRCIGPLAVSACLRPALPCLAPASSSDLPPPHPRPRPRSDPRPRPRSDPRPCPGPALPCLVRPRPRLGPRPLVVSACLRPALPCLVRPRPRPDMWLCTDQSRPPVTNVARNSPPHISNFEIRPLELQRLWAISKNDRVKLRATFGRDPPTTHEPFPRPGLTHPDYPKMSHVIPLQIFQILKSDRWNCNVCGPSRKMTELNYVRLLGGTHQPRTNPFPAPASHTPITQKCRT